MKQNTDQSDRSNAKVFNWIFGLAIVLVSGGIAWVAWRCIDSVQKKDSPRYEQAKKELSTQAVADQLSPSSLLQESTNHTPVGSEIFYASGLEASQNDLFAQAETDFSQVLMKIPVEARKKTTWVVNDNAIDRVFFTRLAYQHRANCYMQEGKYHMAIADLNEAIKLAPDAAYNYENRAEGHRQLGHKALAAEDMKKATILLQKLKDAGTESDP